MLKQEHSHLNKIALVGTIGSGKTTAANFLSKQGYELESFAKPLKDCLSSMFGWDRQVLEGNTEEDKLVRDTVDSYWSEVFGRTVNYRSEAQRFGTEIVRNFYHKDLWVNSLLKRVKNKNKVLVTDARFENEIRALKKDGFKIYAIVGGGPDKPFSWDFYTMLAYAEGADYTSFIKDLTVHESEKGWVKAIDCLEKDFIRNYRSLASLKIQLLSLCEGSLGGVWAEGN